MNQSLLKILKYISSHIHYPTHRDHPQVMKHRHSNQPINNSTIFKHQYQQQNLNHFNKIDANIYPTQHTDYYTSSITDSRNGAINKKQQLFKVYSDPVMLNIKSSRTSTKTSNQYISINYYQQKLIQYQQKLRNIHHFYKIRIEEQRRKNLQKNQIFIGVIEDLQISHNKKVAQFQSALNQFHEQNQDIDYVDDRMEKIRVTIQQILEQSKQLKQENQIIEKQIVIKQAVIRQKLERQAYLKLQLDSLRSQLQNYERIKLKENRRNKQLIDLIDKNIHP